jgi:hypothetical protein
MPRDPLDARRRLRQQLQMPLGEAFWDGEDLRAVLDELDRLLRYREALEGAPSEGPVGPAPRPQNLGLAERLGQELDKPPGAGSLSRAQLRGLWEDWQRLMRLEAYMQHLPSCGLHRADPWEPLGYSHLYQPRPPCSCGFERAYTGAAARASEQRRAAARASGSEGAGGSEGGGPPLTAARRP